MPIHIMWGDDTGARNRSIENIIDKIIDPNWRSFNLSRIDGSDISQANQALEEVRTPPMGNGGRVILVQKSPFCNGCSIELANKLIPIINLIPKETHLILSNKLKPDKRLKTTKSIQQLIPSQLAKETSFILPAVWDEAGQRRLIERTADELNLTLEENAIFCLIEALGNDSTRLISELEKISLLQESKEVLKHPRTQKMLIKTQTVNELLDGLATNSLAVGNCLLGNDIGGALFRIDALLDSGEPALRLIASLTSQIRAWLWVALLDGQGKQEVGVIAKAAGIANPKRIYVIRKQIQGKPYTLFLDLLNRLLEIESEVKRGVIPSNAFKDNLLTK